MHAPQRSPSFRDLADTTRLLTLANIWDAGSARLAESRDAPAVATTSAGLAWAHGFADGTRLPVAVHAHALAAICRVVSCPVTADLESGYADAPDRVAEIVMTLVSPGVQGINLEDGEDSPDTLCRKIEAIKTCAIRQGIDLYVNARTDVYLRGLSRDPVSETLQRAHRYREAGADGLFVPGLADEQEIARIVAGQPLPLNLMAVPGLPPRDRLEGLGVRRLSAGPALLQGLWFALAQRFDDFHTRGSDGLNFDHMARYDVLQGLFSP